jgi:uncharacterized protein (DUF1015 family)
MALIAPFKALRYDPDKVGDLRRVVSPPYDIISPEEQKQLYDSHDHNIIRVELNRTRPEDDATHNCYTRAAKYLENWMAQGVLKLDPRPAFYVNETVYTDTEGNQQVRRGFFTLLRVEDFEKKIVLPHERTFTGHKEDRFKLTRATGANISPIFALYPDDDNTVAEILDESRSAQPVNDFVDPMGLRQRLYTVEDPVARQRVVEYMYDKVLFIADGHHRYETAINYRNYMREKHPEAGPGAPWEYTMVYLCSMSDPGLTIFPCHRVLPKMDLFSSRDFLHAAKKYFDYEEIPIEGDMDYARERFAASLAQADQKGRSFGLCSTESNSFYTFVLRETPTGGDTSWRQLQGPLRNLNVVVLTNLVLEDILGLDEHWRDQVHTIKYVSDMKKVIDEVRTGQARVGFLLNPTRIEQVQAVAEAGLIMPRKATYFYPKVLTGLTLNLMERSHSLPLLSR